MAITYRLWSCFIEGQWSSSRCNIGRLAAFWNFPMEYRPVYSTISLRRCSLGYKLECSGQRDTVDANSLLLQSPNQWPAKTLRRVRPHFAVSKLSKRIPRRNGAVELLADAGLFRP